MYAELKAQIAELLSQPRAVKPQTERQVAQYLQDHGGDAAGFFSRAAELLQEHELEILFAPAFTPSLDEQAAVSDALSNWRPSTAEIEKLTADLCAMNARTVLELPDGTKANLALHEVMISRFVKLLRLEHGPEFKIAAQLQDTLPSELCSVALALMRQRGFTPQRQAWLANFLRHMARRKTLNRAELVAAAEFIAGQTALDTPSLQRAAEEQVRAAKGAAEFVSAGRIYWSPDVAQHHQNRGEGQVDKVLLKQKLEEQAALEEIAAALGSFS